MIENIPTPLVSFAGSGVAGFFMGMFLRRVLKFLVIIMGSFLGAVFLVTQWMQDGATVSHHTSYLIYTIYGFYFECFPFCYFNPAFILCKP
jgi:hypothetical protein